MLLARHEHSIAEMERNRIAFYRRFKIRESEDIMKLYRVCTENKNYGDITCYLNKHFQDGYTTVNANGAWQGQREKSLIIEIVSDVPSIESDIGKLCYWLKKYNDQQAVMLQVIEIECYIK